MILSFTYLSTNKLGRSKPVSRMFRQASNGGPSSTYITYGAPVTPQGLIINPTINFDVVLQDRT